VENKTLVRPIFPVWATILLYTFASVLLMGVFSVFVYLAFGTPVGQFGMLQQFFSSLAMFLGALVPAVLFILYIDCRPLSDLGLGLRGRGRDFLFGISLALLLYLLGFGTSLLLGAVEITSVHFDGEILLGSLCVLVVAALMEEVMIRGYILSRLMSCMNKFVALCISSFIFAFMHLFNPNISFLPIFNIFLAGLMLGAAFLYTRNLCFPITLHVFWNWLQGPLLGYEVSGAKLFPSTLTLHLPEKNIINGGDFGFEGSIICTVLLIITTGAIIYWFEKRNTRESEYVESSKV
jgi:uncharacterized protein